MKYQAGIGPSMKTLHIRAVNDDPNIFARPSLCEATNIVRDYVGQVSMKSNLCKRCFRLLQQSLEKDAAITAELIGVSAIIE